MFVKKKDTNSCGVIVTHSSFGWKIPGASPGKSVWCVCQISIFYIYIYIFIIIIIIINFKVKNQSNPFLKSFVRVHEV